MILHTLGCIKKSQKKVNSNGIGYYSNYKCYFFYKFVDNFVLYIYFCVVSM